MTIKATTTPAATDHAKRKARKNFGRRSAIEPVISHVKHDYRMARNYLKGTIGDTLNLLLAVAAFNCKKWMNAVAEVLFLPLLVIWAAIFKKMRYTHLVAENHF